MNPEDLVSALEVARRLGVTPSAVANWRKRHANFPKAIWSDNLAYCVTSSRDDAIINTYQMVRLNQRFHQYEIPDILAALIEYVMEGDDR